MGRTRGKIAASLIALAALACADAPEDGGERGPRVALLTSGPVSDAGWYAGAYEGLMLIRDSLGARVSHQQTRSPSEFDEAFLSFAAAGYDLIFAHGFEYQDAAVRAGERFPGTTFVVSGGGRVAGNVVPLVFTLEQGSYLAGMLAGGMTRTNVVGMVGGVAIPPARGTFLSFEAGATLVNPEVEVLETFTGNWEDVAAAQEAATAQLRRGADVLIHNVDAASFGFFQAVREANESGNEAWALGMNRDQNDVAPEIILASASIDIPTAFLDVARRWQGGELGGAPVYAGAAEGVVDLILNPRHRNRIPADLLARVDSVRGLIVAGSMEVPRVRFVEGEEEADAPREAGGGA